jgi:hypothetical protein
MLNLEEMMERRKLRRKVSGTVAVLVPYESDGRVAVEAFERLVGDVDRAGLVNAVNMDTGYVNYLSDPEKRDILRWTREALGGHVPFVAGAHIEGREGDVVALYRQQMDLIASFGGTPVLFQTARLHGKPAKEKVAVYRAVCRGYDHVIAFEMGTMFAPNGEIFDEETVRGLMEIPELKGLKHASLDRLEELKRLALRDALRPEFRIYTGNDLGINMIEYGSDYLLGLASSARPFLLIGIRRQSFCTYWDAFPRTALTPKVRSGPRGKPKSCAIAPGVSATTCWDSHRRAGALGLNQIVVGGASRLGTIGTSPSRSLQCVRSRRVVLSTSAPPESRKTRTSPFGKSPRQVGAPASPHAPVARAISG